MAFWRARLAAAARWQPVTFRSLVIFTASFLWYVYLVRQEQDLVLLVASIAGMGLCGLSWVLVGIAGLVVSHRGSFGGWAGEARVQVGVERVTGFSGPGRWALGFVRVWWDWVEPPDVQVDLSHRRGRAHEAVTPARRGLVERVVRRFSVGDPLGLAKISWIRGQEVDLEILPEPAATVALDALQRVGGETLPLPDGSPTGDMVELRRYQPGDPLRRIVWKVFARSRKLVVRGPERAEDPTERATLYLVAGPGDGATASLLMELVLSDGIRGRWVLGVSGYPAVCEDRSSALRALAASGNPGVRPDLTGFLEAVGRDPGQVILFLPAIPGPWLDDLAAQVVGLQGDASAVVGVRGLEVEGAGSGLSRLLLVPPRRTGPSLADLSSLAAGLGAVGIHRALLVDVATGATMPLPGLGGRP